MSDEAWAAAAVDDLLARCLRAVATRLQNDAEAVLMQLLRRGVL